MGTTTERIIEIYNDHDRISGLLLRGNSEDDSLFNSETIEAMNSINVILHKYQKIKNIICKWEVGLYDDEGLCDTEVLELISDEVNGNGNVN